MPGFSTPHRKLLLFFLLVLQLLPPFDSIQIKVTPFICVDATQKAMQAPLPTALLYHSMLKSPPTPPITGLDKCRPLSTAASPSKFLTIKDLPWSPALP
ncbi:hypothetical protein GGI35DRAFT_24810 [Trichoderma velutinum]